MSAFRIFRAALTGAILLAGCGPEELPDVALEVAEVGACPVLSTPIYHRIQTSTGASLYTASASEAASAASLYGFKTDRGVAFQASGRPGPGLKPVYQLFKSRTGDFVWTTSDAERLSAQAKFGYRDEGPQFYAATSSAACLRPVHRFLDPTRRFHRLAFTDADRSALTKAGWRNEGVAFHAAAAGSVTPPGGDGDSQGGRFTFVVIPDTQREVNAAGPRFNNRMQWLAANKNTLDIRFVTQTGDLVDWDTPDHIQYVRASNGLKLLDSAAMPYAIAIGNHDTAAVKPGGSAAPGNVNRNLRNTTTFNRYFPTTRFKNLRGVYEAGKVDNAYHTFEAGGVKWMVINLELWPRTGAVNWAKQVVASFPDHNVIFITHSHLTARSGIEQSFGGYGNNSPQYVYDNLYSQFANVRFVFSGHTGTTGFRQNTGVKGNTFYQFLNCYHDMTTNPTRLMEIDTAAGTVSTRVYSPYTNSEKNDGSKMSLRNVKFVR